MGTEDHRGPPDYLAVHERDTEDAAASAARVLRTQAARGKVQRRLVSGQETGAVARDSPQVVCSRAMNSHARACQRHGS